MANMFGKNIFALISASFLFFFNPLDLQAQEALGVCRALANSGLIDTQSESIRREQAQFEVDIFCSQSGSFESNFSTKSSGFRASFRRVADSIGIGGSSNRGSGYTESEFERICTNYRSDFRSNYSENIDITTGSSLSQNVVSCVDIARNETYIWGEVTANFSGTELLVDVNRAGGTDAGDLKFKGIEAPSEFGDCTSGGQPAVGVPLFTEMALSCPIEAVSGRQPKAVRGVLSWCNDANVCKNISFEAAVRGYEEQLIEDYLSAFREELDSFRGAVIGFSTPNAHPGRHPSCPEGYWEAYQPAEGVFVRGYDPSGRNDPRVDGADPSTWKPVGSVWDDTIKSHGHVANMEIGAEPTSGGAQSVEAAGAHGRIGTNYESTGLIEEYGGAETAPKHVILLYCVKR